MELPLLIPRVLISNHRRANARCPLCASSAIYWRCMRLFAYLLLMKQGFHFLLLEINITLLEQMGRGRMGSMKKKRDNGVSSDAEWAKVINLHSFHMVSFSPCKLGSNVIHRDASEFLEVKVLIDRTGFGGLVLHFGCYLR